MALELLAGPFSVVDINGGSAIELLGPFTWVDPIGIICRARRISGAEYLGVCCVQMDGSLAVYAKRSWRVVPWVGGVTVGQPTGVRGYSVIDDNGTGTSTTTKEYSFDYVTRIAGKQIGTQPKMLARPGAHVPGKLIYGYGRSIRSYNAAGTDVLELDLAASLPPGDDAWSISWAQSASRLWIGSKAGYVFEYDHVLLTATSRFHRIGMACDEHGVFISVTTESGTQKIRVWATTERPTSLSTPVAIGSVKAGKAVTFRTRVLGAQSDPSEGETVAWECSIPYLLAGSASLTDENGYAEMVAKMPLEVSGTINITCKVTY
jgi:hypothetical protein